MILRYGEIKTRKDIAYDEKMQCYSIYTYARGNWKTKAKNHFFPKKFYSRYVDHGIKYEKEALQCYKKSNDYQVCEIGLVICQRYPWLAYSADGIVTFNGLPSRLVEIKCPYDGIDNDAINFVHTCDYLQLSLEGLRLKKRHSYYGQVQLGMAILNLEICDLILYSPKSKSFLNIVVPFDHAFAKEMITTVTEKYMRHMLHILCEKET
ncbi:hypothetical protein NQ315_011329 [Exocentrus adspersus]|uniref:YqaJ viral recombinase domain-containing protein n=1 Tax=Exocentrus adspersus TaxID=1586481 RepID=A0AAV8VJ15_9CUCU|nr:hypothetical protein NQ315_011329 [Exocentrus adspersus]